MRNFLLILDTTDFLCLVWEDVKNFDSKYSEDYRHMHIFFRTRHFLSILDTTDFLCLVWEDVKIFDSKYSEDYRHM